jgi:hypothetical protein
LVVPRSTPMEKGIVCIIFRLTFSCLLKRAQVSDGASDKEPTDNLSLQ